MREINGYHPQSSTIFPDKQLFAKKSLSFSFSLSFHWILNRTILQTTEKYFQRGREGRRGRGRRCHSSVRTRTRSLISYGSIRFVWRTLSLHMEAILIQRRDVLARSRLRPPTRHTPVNFYRNTFRRETGEFPFRGETTRRIYMILCAPAKQSAGRTKVFFSAGPWMSGSVQSLVGSRRRRLL